MTGKWSGRRALLAAAMALLCALTPAAASAHVRSSAGLVRRSRQADGRGRALRAEPGVRTCSTAAAGTRRGARPTPPRSAAYVLPLVQVSVDGVECEGALEAPAPARDGRDSRALGLDYDVPGLGRRRLRGPLRRVRRRRRGRRPPNVTRYELGGNARHVRVRRRASRARGGRRRALATAGALRDDRRRAHPARDRPRAVPRRAAARRAQPRQVVKLATAFTAAHSVTLALGALGWVNVPPEIVEPLIALSIAYVAAENILGGESPPPARRSCSASGCCTASGSRAR